MRYRILCIGRKAKDPLLDATDDYIDRLSHYAQVELLRLREGSPTDERDVLLARVDKRERIIALDEHGEHLTTEGLVKRITQWSNRGQQAATFIIGGTDGLHPDVKAVAHETWALSAMTLPHRMAQAVLAEQLYRAHTIMRGEKYHRK